MKSESIVAPVPAGIPNAGSPAPNSLEHWAMVKPNEVAIIDGETEVTWGAWNLAANRLAEAFARIGVVGGDVVAIRSQIRHEWQFISSALAKLGASILPFNWRLTPKESRHILEDSGAKVLVLDDADVQAFLPAYEGLNLKAVVAIGSQPPAEVLSMDQLLAQTEPVPRFATGRPPLIIYTSGTTGQPKGVVMGELVMSAERMEQLQSVEAADPQLPGARAMLTLPMHHGAGPGTCWSSIAAGNTLIMARRFLPQQALADIQRHRINHWVAVPTMLKRIAALPEDVLRGYDVSSIRSLRTGAAPVPTSLKEWVLGYFGEVLHEAYGATEVGMIAHLGPQDVRRKPGSSGKPYRHVQIRIKDEIGKLLPVGAVGAIWVKSPAVIKRYVNQPLLGRDTIDEDGFFQVGDAGRLDEDGYIYLTDRIKDMIISGGVNIYPAEIESALIQHPAIQDVAVIGVPDEDFGEAVKAFVELRSGATLTANELLTFVEPLLASYKRPRSIEFVVELPRSTMGKILKRELRNPFWQNEERNV
ncbi:AMP-binding protein [Variovorax sp. YR752]|uniref:class I adenylate-forming enzyme family protein n=1 Tax=Variovorax sp. YR752 TaxID=1884383 RepID=UPI0031382B28